MTITVDLKSLLKKIAALALVAPVLLLFYPPSVALAQQEVMITGSDGTNTRPVLVDSAGRLITTGDTTSSSTGSTTATHGACTNTQIDITGTAANVPTSARSDRRTIMICASTSGEVISCEFDGSAAVLATGFELGNLDCHVENLAGTVNASCISDGTTVDVRVMECP